MKTILVLYFLSLALFACYARPAQVIQIMTSDPLQEKVDPSAELSDNFMKTLKNAFDYGKSLIDEDQAGFYDKLKQDQVKFYSPNNFNNYAVMYTIFQGLFSKQTEISSKEVLNDISLLQLKPVDKENGISTIDIEEQELSNTFRVIDSSILLEGSSFDCPSKQTLIEKNKRELPSHVKKTCNSATEWNKEKSLNSIQDVMELYRKGSRSKDSTIENCLEQFAFAAYYSNDLLIKLNAGELLAELAQILSSNDKSTELYSYMIPGEAFLGVLTAIQKMALSRLRKTSSLSHKFYWGSLKNFNKKVVIELSGEDNKEKEDLKVTIQGENNQLMFSMNIELSKFVREIGPFMVTDYMNFQTLCSNTMLPTLDLKTIMLPEDSFLSFDGFKIYLLILLVIVSLAILVLAIIYKKSPKGKPFKKREVEFKRVETDEYDQESGISVGGVEVGGGIKFRKGLTEDDSYAV